MKALQDVLDGKGPSFWRMAGLGSSRRPPGCSGLGINPGPVLSLGWLDLAMASGQYHPGTLVPGLGVEQALPVRPGNGVAVQEGELVFLSRLALVPKPSPQLELWVLPCGACGGSRDSGGSSFGFGGGLPDGIALEVEVLELQ